MLSFPRSAWERTGATLCVASGASRYGTQSVPTGVPTQSVGTRTLMTPDP